MIHVVDGGLGTSQQSLNGGELKQIGKVRTAHLALRRRPTILKNHTGRLQDTDTPYFYFVVLEMRSFVSVSAPFTEKGRAQCVLGDHRLLCNMDTHVHYLGFCTLQSDTLLGTWDQGMLGHGKGTPTCEILGSY